ncbi:TetR family transcriptional regulator [Nocardia amikacinitolerans]|uniref:TetR family transcriptional regulator n=1 Tax=Nocardia amikacinitolerans TaxID=756689 RepID=UPI00117C4213|nr:TetR family transcriptional regulator [Nocardia amikacinitolerans]
MSTNDPRSALLDTAERLIALRGLEVPLRDIAAEAGQRNNSAVHTISAPAPVSSRLLSNAVCGHWRPSACGCWPTTKPRAAATTSTRW